MTLTNSKMLLIGILVFSAGASPAFAEREESGEDRARGQTNQTVTVPKAQFEMMRSFFYRIGDSDAFRAPFGRFLLIRNKKAVVALRVDKHTRLKKIKVGEKETWDRAGMRYTLLIDDDGDKTFDAENAKKIVGEVF